MFCCSRCGDCCKVPANYTFINVVLCNKDIINISYGLQISVREFIDKYCILKELYLDKVYKRYFLKAGIGSCVFLVNNNCLIHEFKPLQCHLAPELFFQKTDLWEHLKCYENLYSGDYEKYEALFIRELMDEYEF